MLNICLHFGQNILLTGVLFLQGIALAFILTQLLKDLIHLLIALIIATRSLNYPLRLTRMLKFFVTILQPSLHALIGTLTLLVLMLSLYQFSLLLLQHRLAFLGLFTLLCPLCNLLRLLLIALSLLLEGSTPLFHLPRLIGQPLYLTL